MYCDGSGADKVVHYREQKSASNKQGKQPHKMRLTSNGGVFRRKGNSSWDGKANGMWKARCRKENGSSEGEVNVVWGGFVARRVVRGRAKFNG
jgi:hypothetical protein